MEIPNHLAGPRVVGRYALHGAIASGGMATVHFGRLLGPVGFSRTVAIKRLHAQFAADPEFVSMFLDEARLAARIRHPNVVPTLDVVAVSGELFLVMDYVPGESLARLMRAARERGQRIPIRVVSTIITGVLHGLHAAHEATTERGEPLEIVHRDVSPQNVLVGIDGAARVLDFGVAKAVGRVQQTRDGQIKGKLAYMAPEQLRGIAVGRQSDIYAAAVLLWEMIAGERLFDADNEGALVTRVLEGKVPKPSDFLPRRMDQTFSLATSQMLDQLDAITLSGLHHDVTQRFQTAREMAVAIERTVAPATASDVTEWVEATAQDVLRMRAGQVAEIESSASGNVPSYGQLGAIQSAESVPRDLGGIVRQPISEHAPSQMSSISVARSSGQSLAPPMRSRAGLMVGSLVLALVVMIIGTAVVWRARELRSAARIQAQDAVDPPPVASAPEEPLAAPVASGVAPAPIVSAAPAAPSVGAGGASEQAPPTRRAPRTPSVRNPPTSPASDCNPPFIWDAEGRKHFKPNCI